MDLSSDRASLSVLVSVDPVLRDSAVAGIALGSSSAVAVRHDLLIDRSGLRRVVVDGRGVLEDVVVPLEHACVSCSIREDAIPTLARLAADGRWSDVILALPVTAEPLPVVRGLEQSCRPHEELARLRLAGAFAVVDLDAVEDDLLAGDWCAERGLALTDGDERAVGEALAAQLEQVDLVVTASSSPTGSGLVDRLRAADSRRIEGVHVVQAEDLRASRYTPAAAERRAHPLGTRGRPTRTGGTDDRSWTLELSSRLPFHPERLLVEVESLGTGPLRSRGAFHVANRPDSLCLWDCAGGQLCIADLGSWEEVAAGREPRTRIVVVGASDRDQAASLRAALRSAFDRALVRPSEAADGGLRWLGRDDVLAPWLGDRTAA